MSFSYRVPIPLGYNKITIKFNVIEYRRQRPYDVEHTNSHLVTEV